jgi:hypothetical protein
MGDIKIIEYSEEYRESAINLLKTIFPDGSNELSFSWRFENLNKYKPIIVCAIDSGKVISFNSWIKWLFEFENKTFVGYQSGESATDRNYRRMGIWVRSLKLGEEIAKSRGYIDFFFGFPAKISFGGLIRAGYLHVGTYNKFIRIINPFIICYKKNIYHKMPANSLQINTPRKEKLTPVVDSKYIEWRYYQNPKNYEIINFYKNNETATFMLRHKIYYNKKYKIKFPEVLLLDCHFTSYDKKFISSSFDFIDRLYSRKAVWIKTFFNETSDKGKALRSQFHINHKEKYGKLLFKKISPDIDNKLFCDFGIWDLQPHVVDSE